MDSKTLDYYKANAKELAQRYESTASSLATHFPSAFVPGGRVLDIGCGSGRDLAELHKLGFHPYGLDGTNELVSLAQILHPELKGRVIQGFLPEFDIPFGGEFDGVVCCAVLMHIQPTELFNAALAIKRCLKVNGRLLISVSTQRSDVGKSERDANGRLFKTYAPGFLQLIFERLGFSLINQWGNADAMSREGIEWVSLLFQLKSAANTRAIDQIEGILNHDKKSATYKFALFRALSELATQCPNSVTWLADDKVGLPVRFVSEKWLQYYWPLLESEKFIPQLNGEQQGGGKPIKFRTNLNLLIAQYRTLGGYSAFRIDRNKGTLSATNQKFLKAVIADIEDAIVKGPVVYSGGALITGRVFDYDTKTKQIIIPKDLWIELSHLGFWVGQAVIIQWAEKTAKLGDGIDVASVINLLLAKEDDRSTVEARKIYSELPKLECVWTGSSLKSAFDVDHVIPFDLWHNNDFWNLLPASKTANGSKSNKLPSTDILKKRKDAIVGYWEILRNSSPARFDKEAETLAPLQGGNWQSQLYGQMCIAIEVTALQRGVGRWPIR
jgi:SAM-dependent methyltransferase